MKPEEEEIEGAMKKKKKAAADGATVKPRRFVHTKLEYKEIKGSSLTCILRGRCMLCTHLYWVGVSDCNHSRQELVSKLKKGFVSFSFITYNSARTRRTLRTTPPPFV